MALASNRSISIEFVLIVPQKSQEVNQWISSVFCLKNHLYLALDNNLFQIETSSQKIEKTYHFDLDTIHSHSVSDDYLLLAGRRDRVILSYIIYSGTLPALDPKLTVSVSGPVHDVQFLSSRRDIQFAVLSDSLHVYRLGLNAYFTNSQVHRLLF